MRCPKCGSKNIEIQEFRTTTLNFDEIDMTKDVIYWCNDCSKTD